MGVIDTAVNFAIDIANDNSHGYSQSSRNGAPDYDCSSLVIESFAKAGLAVKSKGATYTGNMYNAFIQCGFRDVKSSCNLSTGFGMQRGDVLLNVQNHTALFIGNGQIVHARSDDGHPEAGDQTGNEIRVQNYYNGSWDYVLRYSGVEVVSTNTSTSAITSTSTKTTQTTATKSAVDNSKYTTAKIRELKLGDKNASVKNLQLLLIAKGYNVGKDGADGQFGANTLSAVRKFQTDKKISVDGIVGTNSWQFLLNE